MANATASKPAKPAVVKKNSSRKPPPETVWLKYQPNAEGILSWHASAALHALVFGGVVLWGMYLAAYFFGKPNRSLPMEAVSFKEAGGGGAKDGTGDAGGNHAPLKEGVDSDKTSPGDKPPDPTRPSLPDDVAKRVDKEFSPDDARRIRESASESMASFASLDKDLRDKLRDGINPSSGQGGPGKDGGKGPGTGTGTGSGTGDGTGKMLNEREKRMLRWSMKFDTRDGADYLHQLEGLGAILAIPVGPDAYKVVDLAKRPLHMEDRDLATIQRIWWIDENPGSVLGLMRAMQLPGQPSRIVAFIPQELEDDLAKKELAYKGLTADQIDETKFAVAPLSGGKYDVHVSEQTKKK